MRAHGEIFIVSGGSTPMFKQSTRATETVFMRSFVRHFCRSPSSSPSSSAYNLAESRCRSSHKNIGYATFAAGRRDADADADADAVSDPSSRSR
jgi:hypothetical protein